MGLDNIVITKLFDVMTIRIDRGVEIPMKNRHSYGLTYCATKDGLIDYEFNGKIYRSDYNHAVLLPMGQTYKLKGRSSGDFPLINFYCLEPLNNCEFACYELSSPEYFLSLYEQIRTLCLYEQPFCTAKAMGLLYEMFSRLMADPVNDKGSVLSMAVAYMEQHFADTDLTVEQVAEVIHVSPGYFRRIFKEQYALSPKKFILNLRMNKAKGLLLSGVRPPISEVAAKCGFTNIYHFSRTFKDFYGCSPTEYAQKFVD